MPRFSHLILAVCGIRRRAATLEGKPLPPSLQGWKPVVIRYDRFIAAGIFARKAKGKTSRVFRPVVWKWYRDRRHSGQYRTSMSLYPDELDPALRLLVECRDHLPPQ